MRYIRINDTSGAAKIEIEQERRAVITNEEQNAQYRNTWGLRDKMDGENLPHKTAKEELEHGRDQKNITEMMCEIIR